jgi:hypothetical protein
MQAWFQRFGVAFLAGAVGGCGQAVVHHLAENWRSLVTHPTWSLVLGGLQGRPLSAYVLGGALWALLAVPLALLLRVRGAIFGLVLGLVPAVYVLFWSYPHTHPGQSPWSPSLAPGLILFAGYAVWGLVVGMLYQNNFRA